MLTFTEAQVLGWISPLLWPFVRVLALFGAMPVIAQRGVPARLRVALAFLITVCAQSSLPVMPVVALDSAAALLLLIQQVLIGLTLGFAARIVFAAIEFAGELVGLQMGLNFAGFFDPATGGQATAMSRFFGIAISWLFIVINGHLLLIAAVVQSFHAFPVGPEPFGFLRVVHPEVWGAEIFRLGLWIALPMIAMLLFVIVDDNAVNLTLMAALARAATGFEPVRFDDPVRGLAWCRSNGADLIIVDFMMPGMDGHQFIEGIRASAHLADVPVVMVTAA